MTPWLPADVARCRPGCATLGPTCGRLHAPLPPAGGGMVDGTKQWPARWVGERCGGYIPISECTPPAAPARRVHPPLPL